MIKDHESARDSDRRRYNELEERYAKVSVEDVSKSV
jgi:hypothetical protein